MKFHIKNKGRYKGEYVHVWTDFLPNQQWVVEVRSYVSGVESVLNHSGEVHEMVCNGKFQLTRKSGELV